MTSDSRTFVRPSALDGAALLRWGRACLEGLERRREEINTLNVFPIADADTGTNMLATMRAAMQAAETVRIATTGEPSVSKLSAHDVAAAMSRGATLGARGNSGIILSQVLRGIAEAVIGGPLTGPTLRHALARASALVREGLSVPVEGTILTVLDRAADCAGACPDLSLAEVAVAAAEGAAKALGDTPAQLGVLRAAGVVDAGARGLVVLLDSLVSVTLGQTPERPAYVRDTDTLPTRSQSPIVSAAPGHQVESAPHFEVMYLLEHTDGLRVTRLRDTLAELGDSVVVVGDGTGSWSAHVHCVDAGAAVEAGLAAGTLSDIRIESFVVTARPDSIHPDAYTDAHTKSVEQTRSLTPKVGVARAYSAGQTGSAVVAAEAVAGTSLSEDAADRPADRGVLAVAAGAGAAALFEAAGAVVLGGDDAVSSAALLAAIRQLPHREVLVLPNGALPAHELVAVGVAARDANRDVLLLPSGSMVQGLAALAVHDRGRIAVDDGFAMSEAAAATRWGSLRAATERALTMVGTCEPGDGLGLVGNDVVVIDRDVRTAGLTLLDRMLGFGGELVTLLMGATAPAGLAGELAEHIAQGFAGVEVAVYSGGQHGDLVQIGVE
ncbi:DAK2 domain-containing protein [Nocardia australiensis]|uniref:DAK2 domain-containing protein n=1 Tax=Nocardia australiensis TaxID=2887191 RepID=UPI001D14EC6B|nr:DAK2 domain-containing protein [Nocardia australiensis]